MNNFHNFKIRLESKSDCDFCGHDSFSFLFHEMRHGLNIDSMICNNCMLVQSNPMPTTDCISDFYKSYYHLFHNRVGVDSAYEHKSIRNAKRRKDILQDFITLTKTTKLFEIGAGSGAFIDIISRNTESSIEGIEVGVESFEYCKKKGYKVSMVGIEEYTGDTSFDVICSFHVLEHIRSPKLFISKCYELLDKDGYLYLEVPNFNRPGCNYESFLQFPHLFNFTIGTLGNLLRAEGFEPIYVDDRMNHLTIISKKIEYKSVNYSRINLKDYIHQIRKKNKAYRISENLKLLPFTKRIREILRTY